MEFWLYDILFYLCSSLRRKEGSKRIYKNRKTDHMTDISQLIETIQHQPPPQLILDDYRDDLAALGMTQEEEDALLQALWEIMSSFVDLGFGMDSVSLALSSICGEDTQSDTGQAINPPYSSCEIEREVL